MKAFVFSFIYLLCGFGIYGQSVWQEYQSINGIKFSVQEASCSWEGSPSITYKFIKIENQTANRARVSYRLNVYYGNECNGCDGSDEFQSVIVLEPGTQVAGTCNSTIPARLDILVSNPSLPTLQLTQFNISSISIDWLD